MSLTTCAVTFQINLDDGAPDVGATVSATLNQFEVYNGYIVPKLVSGTTNVNGLVVLNLWPNSLGSTGSVYTIKILSSTGKKLTTTATVPNQSSANATDIAGLPAYTAQTDAQYSLSLSQSYAAQASSSATSAANSATAAANSATTAEAAATNASSSIAQVTEQANSAATSATTATNQAAIATNQATTATTQAASATTSATSAASSASTATTQATTATNQAGAASTSATNAASSATSASGSATAAATSATNAANSASSVTASVTQATTAATNSASSASAAASSATSASTSATNAAASAAQAASSADTAVSGGIRYDIAQTLTASNKTQAQSNMGLAAVASSGSYADLSNQPTIPVIGTNVQAWDADLDAIAGLSATSGLLKKTAANTWQLDTSAYLTGITSSQVTTALGFTPTTLAAVATVGYATGGGSASGSNTGDETNATIVAKLGFTPYSNANPSSYITLDQARAGLSVSGSLSYNSTTGVLSYTAPTYASVASSGAYSDLTGKPTIPIAATSSATTDAGYQTAALVAGSYLPILNGSATGLKVTAGKEAYVAISASNIDLSLANFYNCTITAAKTFTLSNVPASGTVASFVLEIVNGGVATITWWSGIKWALGTAPSLTVSGYDVLGFYSKDGGATWNGFILGKGMA